MRHVLKIVSLVGAAMLLSGGTMAQTQKVAIANFGAVRFRLEQVFFFFFLIAGFKEALAEKGFVDGKNVDLRLQAIAISIRRWVPQVLTKLEAGQAGRDAHRHHADDTSRSEDRDAIRNAFRSCSHR